MAGSFDIAMKQLLDACAADWVAWLAPLVGLPASVAAEPLDADLSTVQPTADKVFRLGPPASGLLHIEPQSSWDGGFHDRLLLYNVLLEARYGGPVHTVALLLRREASTAALTGTVLRHFADGREYLRFTYDVVRVWELSADVLLVGGLGATPLALLTDDASPRLPALVTRFAERVTRESASIDEANLLLSCGFILLGLRYDKAVARTLFQGVQKMRESSTYQAILDEGRVEGQTRERLRALRSLQENLIAMLGDRFGKLDPELESRIRASIEDDRLLAATRQVPRIATPADLVL
ncbi:hypothetical protein [Gemmata sp.]|uniref:hypothetical protein n=1 Tax=Gemmata sp. TaxID=1914242 RepID=UPI003F71FCF6